MGAGQERRAAGQAARLIRSRAGAAAPALDVRPVGCDLSSLAALHAFTGWFGRQEQRLDVLVNNAGVMPGQRTRTVDGVELIFATHVRAPWVLIEGLAPLLGSWHHPRLARQLRPRPHRGRGRRPAAAAVQLWLAERQARHEGRQRLFCARCRRIRCIR
jgi:NAD(P)-dependent dehydrogenase (short-subunit alcohol dehydrogenase family)